MGDPWSSGDARRLWQTAEGDGARVLILRPKGQVSELRAGLEALGVCTLSVPVLEVVPPASYAALDEALGRLARFDWVVLTSANAVDAVLARLPAEARIARLAVVGAATLARARAMRLPEPMLAPPLEPPRAVSESLADVLEPEVRRLIAEQGSARVLLPRAEQARDVLPERLRAAGAEVVIAAAYGTGIPGASVPLLHDVFSRRELWPHAIPFTSSSSVTHLLAVLDAAGLTLPPELLRVSIGPVTSATLREHGLAVDAEAEEATVASLVRATVAAIQGRRRS